MLLMGDNGIRGIEAKINVPDHSYYSNIITSLLMRRSKLMHVKEQCCKNTEQDALGMVISTWDTGPTRYGFLPQDFWPGLAASWGTQAP
jgi:hypothetical protein